MSKAHRGSVSSYLCARFGEMHEGPVLAFSLSAPLLHHQLPEAERERRSELISDICVIDGKAFFVLGHSVMVSRGNMCLRSTERRCIPMDEGGKNGIFSPRRARP